ncbi:MAG: hypothetical protein ACLRWP_18725 [Bilophila wadsworthia]
MERCHRAFNACSNETCLTSALHRLVAIAQKELKSERGALFRRDEDDRLVCVAAVNLTDMELKSEQMRPCLEWLDGFSDRPAAPGRGEQGFVCLSTSANPAFGCSTWTAPLPTAHSPTSISPNSIPSPICSPRKYALPCASKKCATRNRGTRRNASSPSCSKRTETLPPCSEPASGSCSNRSGT